MKKIIKRTLLGIAAIVVLLLLFFGWYGYKAKQEVKKLHPTETAYIVDSIYTVKDDFVNIYLIKIGKDFIVFDAGNSTELVKKGMSQLNIDLDKVTAVFLTHTDGDHVGALSLFKNATVYISKQEEQMINGQTSRFAIFKNSLSRRAYSTLDDGQQVDFTNYKVQGILTPGHTPGAMCFLVNEKYLFVGDALSLKDGKIERFNHFFNMDSEAAAKSMSRLTQFPSVQYIFTAHYGFTNDYKNAVSNWK